MVMNSIYVENYHNDFILSFCVLKIRTKINFGLHNKNQNELRSAGTKYFCFKQCKNY